MISLVSGLLFVGYLLVYAAVKDGGKYAARPWDAIFPVGTPAATQVRQAATGRPVGRPRPGG